MWNPFKNIVLILIILCFVSCKNEKNATNKTNPSGQQMPEPRKGKKQQPKDYYAIYKQRITFIPGVKNEFPEYNKEWLNGASSFIQKEYNEAINDIKHCVLNPRPTHIQIHWSFGYAPEVRVYKNLYFADPNIPRGEQPNLDDDIACLQSASNEISLTLNEELTIKQYAILSNFQNSLTTSIEILNQSRDSRDKNVKIQSKIDTIINFKNSELYNNNVIDLFDFNEKYSNDFDQNIEAYMQYFSDNSNLKKELLDELLKIESSLLFLQQYNTKKFDETINDFKGQLPPTISKLFFTILL